MNKPWQDSELDLLDSLAGSHTVQQIGRRLRHHNKKRSLPLRTDAAIKNKLRRLGYSERPWLDNVPRVELARILGVTSDRARSWSRYYGMPVHRGAQLSTVRFSEFRQWAYKHPGQLAGIESDRLNWIMDDLEFCEDVEVRRRKRAQVPIVRASDGKTFKNLKAAAKASFVSPKTLRDALKEPKKEVAGSVWLYKGEEAIA